MNLWWILGIVAATLTLFYVMGRYRLTAAPCLWILAAGAVDGGLSALRAPARPARRLGVLALAVAAPLALGSLDLGSELGGDHTSWANASTVERVLAERAEAAPEAARHRDRAVAWARRALAIAPLFPSAHAALVRALGLARPDLEPRREEAGQAAWRLLLVLEGVRTGQDVRAPLAGGDDAVRAAALLLLDRPDAPGGAARAGPLLGYAARCVAQDLKAPDEQALALRLVDRSLAFDPDEPLALVMRGGILRRMRYRHGGAAGEVAGRGPGGGDPFLADRH